MLSVRKKRGPSFFVKDVFFGSEYEARREAGQRGIACGGANDHPGTISSRKKEEEAEQGRFCCRAEAEMERSKGEEILLQGVPLLNT